MLRERDKAALSAMQEAVRAKLAARGIRER